METVIGLQRDPGNALLIDRLLFRSNSCSRHGHSSH